jgi:DNA-binding PadR family transcriptional regulator
MTDIDPSALDRELKKGAAELLLLSVLEARPRHGYELGKLIEAQSGGRLVFHLDSLYPLLYRLEERGWIKGAWVEKPGERRRRFYRLTATGRKVLAQQRLTATGRKVLAQQRLTWNNFVEAVRLVTGGKHA